MDRLDTQTALGPVPVWRRGRGESDLPLVLVIRGAFPPAHHMEDLQLSGADAAFLHLPGFFSQTLTTTSIAAFAAAFDQVLAARFSGRTIVLLGVSTGALVALAMRAAEIRTRVLVEPVIRPAKAWPLVQVLRRVLVQYPQPAEAAWVEAIFGVTAEGVGALDYSEMVNARVPTWALVGSEPSQPTLALPSLLDEADRRLLEDRGLEVRIAPGGHDVPANAPQLLMETVSEAIHAAKVAPG